MKHGAINIETMSLSAEAYRKDLCRRDLCRRDLEIMTELKTEINEDAPFYMPQLKIREYIPNEKYDRMILRVGNNKDLERLKKLVFLEKASEITEGLYIVTEITNDFKEVAIIGIGNKLVLNKDCSYMFSGLKVKELKFIDVDATEVLDAHNMFAGMIVGKIDFNKLDFRACRKFTNFVNGTFGINAFDNDLVNENPEHGTEIMQMFSKRLKELVKELELNKEYGIMEMDYHGKLLASLKNIVHGDNGEPVSAEIKFIFT